MKSSLKGFRNQLSTDVADLLGKMKEERSEITRAWGELLSSLQGVGETALEDQPEKEEDAGDGLSEQVVEKQTDSRKKNEEEIGAGLNPQTAAIVENKPHIEEASEKEEVASEDGLPGEVSAEEKEEDCFDEATDENKETSQDQTYFADHILGCLDDTTDGLRLVEIAEVLHIENWRSLIPAMRVLLKEGKVRKEDSTYFIVKEPGHVETVSDENNFSLNE